MKKNGNANVANNDECVKKMVTYDYWQIKDNHAMGTKIMSVAFMLLTLILV